MCLSDGGPVCGKYLVRNCTLMNHRFQFLNVLNVVLQISRHFLLVALRGFPLLPDFSEHYLFTIISISQNVNLLQRFSNRPPRLERKSPRKFPSQRAQMESPKARTECAPS